MAQRSNFDFQSRFCVSIQAVPIEYGLPNILNSCQDHLARILSVTDCFQCWAVSPRLNFDNQSGTISTFARDSLLHV